MDNTAIDAYDRLSATSKTSKSVLCKVPSRELGMFETLRSQEIERFAKRGARGAPYVKRDVAACANAQISTSKKFVHIPMEQPVNLLTD